MRTLAVLLFASLCSIPAVPLRARAQTSVVASQAAPAAQPADGEQKPAPSAFKIGAYVETFYGWNFNRPSNRITNYRGFDNRHDSFTLANVALDAQWDYQNVIGRVTLQVGHTPSTYYMSEPAEQGASGANATRAEHWKYLQQAYIGYRLAKMATLSAGLFLSPIGPESMAIKDNWNWSRSNEFYGCPFYHTGARAQYALTDRWSFTLAAYNGWNSVVDNNAEKSLAAQVNYNRPNLALSALYFGGVERATGAPEGQPWRHLFDAHATWTVTPWLSLLAHGNGGFEDNRFGTSHWGAGAFYTRWRVWEKLFFATRGDLFREHTASSSAGRASPIFWPGRWVSSGTATLDVRANDHIAFMLEYRHDQAQSAMYFGGKVAQDPHTSAFIANRRSQDTLTMGATAWF